MANLTYVKNIGESNFKLGSLIRFRRTSLGISLNSLAKQLEVSNSLLSLIEDNERIPNLKLFFDICSKLGLLPHELLLKAHLDNINKINEKCWENDFERIRKSVDFIDKKFLHPLTVEVVVTKEEENQILAL